MCWRCRTAARTPMPRHFSRSASERGKIATRNGNKRSAANPQRAKHVQRKEVDSGNDFLAPPIVPLEYLGTDGGRPRANMSYNQASPTSVAHDDDEGEILRGDQVMRIRAPAANLPDVRRVKKDLNHNKPNVQRKQSMLTRAVSGVIGSDRARPDKNKVVFPNNKVVTSTGREINVPQHLHRASSQIDRQRPQARQSGVLKRSVSSMSTGMKKSSSGLMKSISNLGLQRSRSKSSSNKSKSRSSSSRSSNSQSRRSSNAGQAEKKKEPTAPTPNQATSPDRPRKNAAFASSPAGTPGGVPTRFSKIGRTPSRGGSSTPLGPTANQPDVLRDEARSSAVLRDEARNSASPTSESSASRKERALGKLRASISARAIGKLIMSPSSLPSGESQAASYVGGLTTSPSGKVSSPAMQRSASRRKSVLSPQSAAAASPVQPLTADKLDGRGNNFFWAAVRSLKIRDAALLGDDSSRLRVPVLTLAEYSGPVSKSRWYVDAFSLPHNAVRRECMDMYDLIIGIAKLCAPDDIMSDDICSFYDWWVVAARFIRSYFEVERKVLIPWVDSIGTKDSQVKMAMRKMRGMKDSLKSQFSEIDNAFDLRQRQTPQVTFSHVYNAVDAFVPRLINYFADQEVLLPRIVKEHYTIEDRLKMDKELVTEFMKESKDEDANHNVVLLVRWMTNPRQQRAFISKYLSSSARGQYSKWQSAFDSDHYRFVQSIKSRTESTSTEG